MGDVGFISALTREGRCLTRRDIPVERAVRFDVRAVAVICGMGAERVRRGVAELRRGEIAALVSWGVAAALDDALRAGDVVLATAVVAADGRRYPLADEWNTRLATELEQRGLRVRRGLIAGVENVLATAADKARLRRASTALAADMESLTVARLAREARLPCIAVRAIVDEAAHQVPAGVTRHTDDFGEAPLLPLLGALARSPALLPELLRLGRGMRAATRALGVAASAPALFVGPVRAYGD